MNDFFLDDKHKKHNPMKEDTDKEMQDSEELERQKNNIKQVSHASSSNDKVTMGIDNNNEFSPETQNFQQGSYGHLK
jgi:hypothetical protein